MGMMRLMQFGLTAMLLLVSAANSADACSCGTGPVCSHYFESDAVFIGTVQRIAKGAQDRLQRGMLQVDIGVNSPFRGVNGSAVTVVTADNGAACGYTFQVGERYLVYAHRTPDGTLEVSLCSRTIPLAKATEDLQFIQSVATGTAHSRVYGRITHWERDYTNDRSRDYGAMPDVLVTVRGPGGGAETRTDDQGRYELAGLPVGVYDVAAFPPANFTGSRLTDVAEIRDPRSCQFRDFNLVYDNRITGAVTTASGDPVDGAQVELMAAAKLGMRGNVQTLRMKTVGGRFEFTEVPAGRYVVGVDLTRRMDPTLVFPQTLYVRSGDAVSATIVEAGGGGQQELAPIIVPAPRRALRLTGTVRFEDGRPAPEVFVSLVDGDESWRQVAVGIKTGPNGEFSFTVHEGLAYIARSSSAELSGGERKYLQAALGPFMATEQTGPLSIVLSPKR